MRIKHDVEDDHLTPHFRAKEFACKHCAAQGVNLALVWALEDLRQIIGKPIIIGSGYRCPVHPQTLKRPGSKHALGTAADIYVRGMSPRELYSHVLKISQFKGIGVDDRRGYVHVDIRETPAKWCYDLQGKPIAFHEA